MLSPSVSSSSKPKLLLACCIFIFSFTADDCSNVNSKSLEFLVNASSIESISVIPVSSDPSEPYSNCLQLNLNTGLLSN